ncbi:conserved protein, unknown function [Plasmodium malariae]|uniref:GAF domain-containing protein n=1 Tax=Plasmodium malariae TaxID=5858 RepID=A0A1A8VZP7_PLAMA|nr:conserved protein, unknown function [Plasmodium malariae]
MKNTLCYNIRFNERHQFRQLSNFFHFKENRKNMYSFYTSDRKNMFMEKRKYHTTPKCHLQTQIITSVVKNKKQNFCLIKRKKRKVHSNYFKYGINISKEKINGVYLYQLLKFLQCNKIELRKFIKSNKIKIYHVYLYNKLNSLNSIERKKYSNIYSFHSKVVKCNEDNNEKGKIPNCGNGLVIAVKEQTQVSAASNEPTRLNDAAKGWKHQSFDQTDEQKKIYGSSKSHYTVLQNSKRYENSQVKSDPSSKLEKKKEKSSYISEADNIIQQKVLEESLKNMYTIDNANNVNSSKKYDQNVFKRVEYNSKDFEKQIDEKSHEKGEMNIKKHDLILVALSGCIPFICFGFVDNSFMIISGDLFDSTFCIFLGFSTMAAAGLGNLTSDVLGIFIGGYIEKIIAYVGFPRINLTNKQLKMNRTRRYYYIGSAIGIAIGCLLGMIPLLFIDSNKLEEKKNRRRKKKNTSKFPNIDKTIFNFVSSKLPSYINSNYAFLFILDKANNNFYSYIDNQLVHFPLSDGIIGEVYKSKKTINYESGSLLKNFIHLNMPINNQEQNQKFENDDHQKNATSLKINKNANLFFEKKRINVHQIMAAPVFSLNETIIGVVVVINATNKISFNDKDANFLNMFCSHISQEIEDQKGLDVSLK